VAVALHFEADAPIVSATQAAGWVEFPGLNPITNGPTWGVYHQGNQAFFSLLSGILTDPHPGALLGTIVTSRAATTLTFGRPSYPGNIVAQDGKNFAVFGSRPTVNPEDVNQDGAINLLDIKAWVDARYQCPTDIDGDGNLGFPDFAFFKLNFGRPHPNPHFVEPWAGQWLPPGVPGPGDIDGDNVINLDDWSIFINAFGGGCAQSPAAHPANVNGDSVLNNSDQRQIYLRVP
jgi:hypothetical protein